MKNKSKTLTSVIFKLCLLVFPKHKAIYRNNRYKKKEVKQETLKNTQKIKRTKYEN